MACWIWPDILLQGKFSQWLLIMRSLEKCHKSILILLYSSGPFLETSSGHKYVLTLVDYCTKFADAYPLPSKEAREVCRALIEFFCTWGTPKRLLSDQGREFNNKVMLEHSYCWFHLLIKQRKRNRHKNYKYHHHHHYHIMNKNNNDNSSNNTHMHMSPHARAHAHTHMHKGITVCRFSSHHYLETFSKVFKTIQFSKPHFSQPH